MCTSEYRYMPSRINLTINPAYRGVATREPVTSSEESPVSTKAAVRIFDMDTQKCHKTGVNLKHKWRLKSEFFSK